VKYRNREKKMTFEVVDQLIHEHEFALAKEELDKMISTARESNGEL